MREMDFMLKPYINVLLSRGTCWIPSVAQSTDTAEHNIIIIMFTLGRKQVRNNTYDQMCSSIRGYRRPIVRAPISPTNQPTNFQTMNV